MSVGAYARADDFRLNTTEAQAKVLLAGDVHYELTGYEFVQWPSAGQHLLFPRIVDNRASWADPTTEAVIAPIECWSPFVNIPPGWILRG